MYARRRRWYVALMGTCVVLFVMAGAVVRMWSVPAAIAMCLVAMIIPPTAAIMANRREPGERWWDEPKGDSGDAESDAWWAELEGHDHKDHHGQPPQGGSSGQ